MLISWQTLKNRLGVPATDNSRNAEFEALAATVSNQIIRFIGFNPSSKSCTEYYDGDGSTRLLLRRKPVISVESVYVDVTANAGVTNAFTDPLSLLTPNVGYVLELDQFKTGTLLRVNNVWPQRYERRAGNLGSILYPNPGCIKVTYTAGEVNPVFEEAGILECKALFAFRPNGLGAIMSESIDSRSISLTTPQSILGNQPRRFVSEVAQLLLMPYQDIAAS